MKKGEITVVALTESINFNVGVLSGVYESI